MEAADIHHLNQKDAKEKIQNLICTLKLNEAVLNRYPYQVSGGEIQRVALCRRCY